MSNSMRDLRILNTRPKDQATGLSQAIREAGGISIECPTLEIKARTNQWIQALPDLHQVHYAVFVSVNAVHCCFQELLQKNLAWPSTIHVVAMGQASQDALNEYHIFTHEMPSLPDSEHLLALDSFQNLNNQSVLLFKGVGGRPLIEDALTQQQAKWMSVEVYQRDFPEFNPQWIESIWRNDLVDIILITSLESLHNLFKLFGDSGRSWLQSKTCLVLSKRLAEAAFSLGIKNTIISHPNRMLDALLRIR